LQPLGEAYFQYTVHLLAKGAIEQKALYVVIERTEVEDTLEELKQSGDLNCHIRAKNPNRWIQHAPETGPCRRYLAVADRSPITQQKYKKQPNFSDNYLDGNRLLTDTQA